MFLDCAMGLATISRSCDAMAENKRAWRFSDVKLMDVQIQCIHHVAKSHDNL